MKVFVTAILILITAGLTACASMVGEGGPPLGAESVRYGTITRIDPVRLEGNYQLGLGAVLGAAAVGWSAAPSGGVRDRTWPRCWVRSAEGWLATRCRTTTAVPAPASTSLFSWKTA